MTRATTFRATAVIGGVLLAMLMIMTVSRAAFMDTTANTSNQVAAGTVVLTDDDGDQAMFTLSSYGTMSPDAAAAQGSECITVIYQGTVDANVILSKIDVTDSTPGLAQYLKLNVFTGDFSSGCTGGTLAGTINPLPAGTTDLTLGSWSPTGGGPDDTMGYRFELWFDTADDDVQGKQVDFDLTWTATSN